MIGKLILSAICGAVAYLIAGSQALWGIDPNGVFLVGDGATISAKWFQGAIGVFGLALPWLGKRYFPKWMGIINQFSFLWKNKDGLVLPDGGKHECVEDECNHDLENVFEIVRLLTVMGMKYGSQSFMEMAGKIIPDMLDLIEDRLKEEEKKRAAIDKAVEEKQKIDEALKSDQIKGE